MTPTVFPWNVTGADQAEMAYWCETELAAWRAARIAHLAARDRGLARWAALAVAHHALQAEFDTSKRGSFTGVLTKFSMVNPHVRWYFDVKLPDGSTAKWELTGAGPQPLRANGMVRMFKVGEEIKCTYAPARDGSNTGRVVMSLSTTAE